MRPSRKGCGPHSSDPGESRESETAQRPSAPFDGSDMLSEAEKSLIDSFVEEAVKKWLQKN